MKRTTTILTALVFLTLGLLLAACSAQKAQKEVDEAAQGVVDARVKNQIDPSPTNAALLTAAMEKYSASVTRFERAKAEDDSKWEGITALVGFGSLALGIPLGGLVDPFRKLITGQVQGARIATTAITEADTANVFQTPAGRNAVLAGLAEAHPKVAAAVVSNL